MRMQLRRTVSVVLGGVWGDEPAGLGEDIAVVRVADFDYPALAVTRAPTVRSVPASVQHVRRLIPGDLLIEKSGGGDRQNVGRVVRFEGDDPATYSNFIALLRPAPGFDARYLTYLHCALYLHGVASAATKQTTGIQNLDLSAYLSTAVQVPSKSQQHEIADFLDRECERIAGCAAELELQEAALFEHAAGVFTAALGKVKTLPLRRFATSITDGPFGSSLASDHYVDGGEVRVIRLGNVGVGKFLDTDKAFISSAYASETLRQHRVHPGDVIVAGLGDAGHPLGRACVVPVSVGPAIHKADCYRVVIDPTVGDPSFVALALSLGPAQQEAPLLSRGSTRARLNTVVARDLPVPACTLLEQARLSQQVAQARSRASRLAAKFAALREGLTEYRDALITEAVTGKLDVTRFSDEQLDESAHAAMEGAQPEVLPA